MTIPAIQNRKTGIIQNVDHKSQFYRFQTVAFTYFIDSVKIQYKFKKLLSGIHLKFKS